MLFASCDPSIGQAVRATWVACLLLAAPAWAQVDDFDAPVISHSVDRQVPRGVVRVDFTVTDASDLYGVLFNWRHVGERDYRQLDFPTSRSSYTAEFEVSRDFEFWIEAYDEFGNGPGYDGTPDLPHIVRVVERHMVTETLTARRLPDPVDLRAADEPVGDWEPPEGSVGPLANTRVNRVLVARALKPGTLEVRGGAALAFGSDFLVPGESLFGQDASLEVSFGILDVLQVSAGTGLRHSALTHSMISAGDLRFAARAVTGDFGAARLGIEATLDVPAAVDRDDHPAGEGCVTASGAACPSPRFVVSPGIKGFASLTLSSLRLHANLGYRWDNSEGLLPGRWSDFTTYALALSRYDQLGFGLAMEYAAGKLTPFVEWTLDVPLDRRSYHQCRPDGDARTCGPDAPLFPASGGQMPQRLELGARYDVSPQLAFDAGLELSLTSASRGLAEPGVVHLMALEGLSPPPPVAARFGLVWQWDTRSAGAKPRSKPKSSAIDPDFTF